MFSLVSALIFVPCLLFLLIVVLGVNLLRMSFGGKTRRKSAADAQRTDKKTIIAANASNRNSNKRANMSISKKYLTL